MYFYQSTAATATPSTATTATCYFFYYSYYSCYSYYCYSYMLLPDTTATPTTLINNSNS